MDDSFCICGPECAACLDGRHADCSGPCALVDCESCGQTIPVADARLVDFTGRGLEPADYVCKSHEDIR